MNEKTFTAAAALVFLVSFFVFNSYTNYELKHSKLDDYKYLNNFHSKRVNAKIAESFEGISNLKSLQKQTDNYTLAGLNSGAHVFSTSSLDDVLQVRPSNTVGVQAESEVFYLEKLSLSNNIDFGYKETVPAMVLAVSSDEIFFVPESNSKVNKLNFYVGLAFNSKLGLANHYNSNYAKKFTADVFNDPTGAEILDADQSLVVGFGGQVFGGVMLNNGISLETGINYSTLKGSARYSIEHSYIREIERLEWIVSGEDDAEAIVSKDYVESVAMDTVSSTFSRSSILLPLTISYSFDFGRIKPFVSAGASVNITTNGNQNIYSSFQNKSSMVEESQRIDQLNLQAGLGVDIEISNRFNARIKPTIDLGVWNKNPDYMSGNLRDLTLQTGLYYKF